MNKTDLIYNLCRYFFMWLLRLFYREIIIVNENNVLDKGPLVIYSNHRNHVTDGMTFIDSLTRPVRVVTSAKSMKKPGIGHYLRASNVIGVERIEDAILEQGPGTIQSIKDNLLEGNSTNFQSLTVGSSIILQSGLELKVHQIISKDKIVLEGEHGDRIINEAYSFKVKPNNHKMLQEAHSSLKEGGCVAIYPEGASHDLLEMRPFKVGVCAMVLGSMEHDGIEVPLLPCAIHCYKQHTFRSTVILEFGKIHQVPENIYQLNKTDHRQANSLLLNTIEKNVKNLAINFDSYDQFPAVLLSRQLYQLNFNKKVSLQEKLELNRRFARGFMKAKEDQRYAEDVKKIIQLSQFLRKNGFSVRKAEIKELSLKISFIYYLTVAKIILWSILMLPGCVIWGWTAPIIYYLSQKQRLYWKKRSRVVQHCHHLVSGYKLFVMSLLLLSSFVFNVFIFRYVCREYQLVSKKYLLQASLSFFLLQPLYCFVLAKVFDLFLRDWQHIKYLFLRMYRPKEYFQYVETKNQLQAKVLKVVEELGGEVTENFQENRVLSKTYLNKK